VVFLDGGLSPSLAGTCVYVDPALDNASGLLPLIQCGDADRTAVIAVIGSPSTGKTTHVFCAAQKLQPLLEPLVYAEKISLIIVNLMNCEMC